MSKEKCPFCGMELRTRYSEPPIYMWDCGTKRLPDGLTCRSDDCYEREIAALKAALEKIGTINDKYVALGLQWAAEKLSGDAIAAGLSLGLAEISAVLEGLKKEDKGDE